MRGSAASSNRVRAWIATVTTALAIAIGVSACGSTETPAAPTTSSPKSPTAESTDESEVFDPVLEFEERTLVSADEDYPVFVDVELPKVSGVDQGHARAFTQYMEDDLLDELHAHSDNRAVALTEEDGDRYCEASEFGGCGNQAWFDISAAEIYEDYATVSYTLGTHVVEVAPQTRAMSVTMNLRTGEMATPQDFISGDPGDLTLLIATSGECTEDYAHSVDPNDLVDAFSPTTKGLYFSWDAGRFSSTACGVGNITIPWDHVSSDSQTDGAAHETATPSATTASCAGDPDLPNGIDERVCSSTVTGAQELSLGRYNAALILSPSENIVCSYLIIDEPGFPYLDCIMIEPFASFGIGAQGAGEDISHRSDGPVDATPVTLEYGEAATVGQFACLSEEIGMSCWNTETKHGIFLSRNETLTW